MARLLCRAAACGGRRDDRFRAPGRRDAGVTLVEMLVALALFALIGLAGFGVLNTILRTEERSEGRMERVQRIDGALRLLAGDLETGVPATLRLTTDTVEIAAWGGDAGVALDWRLEDGALIRRFRRDDGVSGETDAGIDQSVLDGVIGWRWRGVMQDGTWVDDWSPDGQDGAPKGAEVVMDLRTGAGTFEPVRRLFVLPDVAPPPPRRGVANTGGIGASNPAGTALDDIPDVEQP